YTFDSVIDPKTASLKRAGFEVFKALDIIDDYTLRITTSAPYAAAREMATLGIVPEGTPANVRAIPPGTGPFTLKSFARDERIVLVRNPYRPAPEHSAREIVFKIVPDPTVRVLELAEGVCDFAENAIQPDLLQ